MTYRKIYFPEVCEKEEPLKSAVAEMKASEIIPLSVNQEEVHCPEIVAVRNKYTIHEKPRFGIFRISGGKIVAVTALCMTFFVLGCSVTNERLADFICKLASISLVSEENESDVAEDVPVPTYYEKYMASGNSEALPTVKAEFLSVEAPVGVSEPTEVSVAEEVSVSGLTDGKIGVDGEVLYAVHSRDMSASDIHLLNNATKFNPDTYALASKTPKALENLTITGEPLVLVVHTHGTECYNSYENENFVGASTPTRTENINENVVGIGNKLVEILNGFGIPAIHSEKMCDKESFVNAYSTSYAEVQSYLDKYPSIRFVIDLHRDATENSDGSKIKPVFADYNGNNAQLMFVVGTNQSGGNHPDWQDNLSLALTLQSEISADNPKLFRKINLRTASFNQQLSDGYMLLECGSAANTFSEAEKAVELFATGFARVITKYAK